MNSMALFQLKSKIEKFKNNHPKVPMFFKDASGRIEIGSIIEVKLTSPDGKSMLTNIKVTQDDIDLFNEISSQIKK